MIKLLLFNRLFKKDSGSYYDSKGKIMGLVLSLEDPHPFPHVGLWPIHNCSLGDNITVRIGSINGPIHQSKTLTIICKDSFAHILCFQSKQDGQREESSSRTLRCLLPLGGSVILLEPSQSVLPYGSNSPHSPATSATTSIYLY